MKKIYSKCYKAAGLLYVALLCMPVHAQLSSSEDKASNYADGEFTYGSGAGTGFVPWHFLSDTTPTSGYALSSSAAAGMGNVDTDGKAFMLYAYGGQGVSLARFFRGTGSVADPGDARSYLLPGQVFSIELAIGNRDGYKGIDITSGNQQDRLATLAVDGGHYRFGDMDFMNEIDNSVNHLFPFDPQSVFIIKAYQVTAGTPASPGVPEVLGTHYITLTRGDVTISTGIMPGNIGGFKVYNGSTSGDNPLNRIYFNNPRIERRCLDSTEWNGTEWSNGIPDITKQAVVSSGTLTIDDNMEMCTLYVTGTAQVIVQSGINLTVANEVNVAAGAFMAVENNANLIQIDNIQNTGSIKVFRNSSAIKRLDYTLWSSPVGGQNLFGFSPLTLANRFYTYNSSTNLYNAIPDLGPESVKEFEEGQSYLIRVANNHPTSATIWQGEFEGLPNNGTVTVPMNSNDDPDYRFTLVGNPYPSPISIDRFIDRNALSITGQLWFWRKTNNPATGSYCTVMADGDYVGNDALEDTEAFDPLGVIRTGQGFFIEALSASPGNVIFNNSLRVPDNSNRFFRTAANGEVSVNRLWLNVSKEGKYYGQTLINYRTGATMGLDYGMDGKARVNDGAIKLYSISGDESLAIQARSLPFSDGDVVQLGLRAEEAGTLIIVLDKFDGLFTTQDVYLEDTYLNVFHNIKNGGYEFATEAGNFTDRFRVVYSETLDTDLPDNTANSLIVYKQGNSIHLNSGNAAIASVEIFDVRGRKLFNTDAVNANEMTIGTLLPQQQFLIINTVTESGVKISKKIIF
ncbi:T9SS sorting signal type C domain-containing protein [uncultured Flavobacterium sp.]|uniref:T9SS sorting signal type C domain-containing protein n=1 Tax=uncultured Flavobacterium sp. TaxID=165435 RepID=UPI0025F4D3C0|nr:T9SS sorting signal type C domain-containing protein [uncultured Flavobacterium sp.]